MFLVEGTQPARRCEWVAGVFAHQADAEKFRASIPGSYHTKTRIHALPTMTYPFLIVMKMDTCGVPQPNMERMNVLDAATALRTESLLRPDVPLRKDWRVPLGIIFAVTEDWCPEDAEPGASRMAELVHFRVYGDTILNPLPLMDWLIEIDPMRRGPLEDLRAHFASEQRTS
jgi:hypothetical protein